MEIKEVYEVLPLARVASAKRVPTKLSLYPDTHSYSLKIAFLTGIRK